MRVVSVLLKMSSVFEVQPDDEVLEKQIAGEGAGKSGDMRIGSQGVMGCGRHAMRGHGTWVT